jgi:hypothetical protein
LIVVTTLLRFGVTQTCPNANPTPDCTNPQTLQFGGNIVGGPDFCEFPWLFLNVYTELNCQNCELFASDDSDTRENACWEIPMVLLDYTVVNIERIIAKNGIRDESDVVKTGGLITLETNDIGEIPQQYSTAYVTKNTNFQTFKVSKAKISMRAVGNGGALYSKMHGIDLEFTEVNITDSFSRRGNVH